MILTKHPEIKFKIDEKKDVNTFFDFSTDAGYDGGRILDWAILKKYPVLKKQFNGFDFVGEKSFIEGFVHDLYEKNHQIMEKNLDAYDKDWNKIEKEFYHLTDSLFPLQDWPAGKYVSFLTMWGMYPRFLEDKTFQIPFKLKEKKYVNVIIAHEMLHFIFYSYFLRKYPEYKENDNFVWHVSEIFNVIIQNLPKWMVVFKVPSFAYPEHEKIVIKIQKENKSDWNVDELIGRIMAEVRNSSL